MGYTHYFTTKETIDEETWNKITTDFKTVLEYTDIEICNGQGIKNTKPIITQDIIEFNGCQGYEPAIIYREKSCFNFCKTNHNPYDTVLVALLLIIKKYTNNIDISSDGGTENWQDGVLLFERSIK